MALHLILGDRYKSYENRKMCVRYKGAESSEQAIPGGGPQGGLLTVILFNLQVNLAGMPCPNYTLLPLGIPGPELDPALLGPRPPCHDTQKTMKKKYVDDLSMLEALDLKSSLVPCPTIIGPLNLHEQPGLCLPPDQSILQHQLKDLLEFTINNKMKINFKKTKILPFNLSKKYDFLPQLFFPDHEPLDVIYETRLLGITLTSNLSWAAHVDDICARATKKLWILIRFKSLGGSQDQLLCVYQTRIRSTLEFAAPVFTGALTKQQEQKIELVQKKAFAIILGNQYASYQAALLALHQDRLDVRREKLCLKFASKCVKSEKHGHMFKITPNNRSNARWSKPFVEPLCHTARYYYSPIPFLTRLLNKNTPAH